MPIFLYNVTMKRIKYTSQFNDLFEKEKPVKDTRYRFEIVLDSVRDRELIDYLEKQSNKSQYIRDLIREDIDAD